MRNGQRIGRLVGRRSTNGLAPSRRGGELAHSCLA
jgi:hypothetical protein